MDVKFVVSEITSPNDVYVSDDNFSCLQIFHVKNNLKKPDENVNDKRNNLSESFCTFSCLITADTKIV